MFANLIAAIEADINSTKGKILELTAKPVAISYELEQLQKKKKELAELAMDYVKLENRYREISASNSVY